MYVRSVALSWVKEKHGTEEMGMATGTGMGTGRQQQLQGKRNVFSTAADSATEI